MFSELSLIALSYRPATITYQLSATISNYQQSYGKLQVGQFWSAMIDKIKFTAKTNTAPLRR